MGKKIRVAVLFGGESAEHEVSLQSAKNIIEAINPDKYEVLLIGIDKSGRWYFNAGSQFLLHADDPKRIKLSQTDNPVAVWPGAQADKLMTRLDNKFLGRLDVVLPILHGPLGEDGTIQGLFKLLNIACVGSAVLSSAVCMDKDVMKRLLKEANILTPSFVCLHAAQQDKISPGLLGKTLGLPLFVKPANMGSSVGISKAKDKQELQQAMQAAFKYDAKIIIEECIEGREIECAVLGNGTPRASVLGEIIPKHEFYSYDAKYVAENGAALEIPAKLPARTVKKIQALALKAFKVLDCQGMARVDCFLKKDGKLYVNELNTIPGFTKISMYPKLWEASGIGYADLIDKLITLALERQEQEAGFRAN